MKALFLEVGTWFGEGRLRLAMIFMGSFLTELQGFILVITCNLTCNESGQIVLYWLVVSTKNIPNHHLVIVTTIGIFCTPPRMRSSMTTTRMTT